MRRDFPSAGVPGRRRIHPVKAGSLAVGLLLLLLLSSAGMWLDLEWYKELGQPEVFWTLIAARWAPALAAGAIALAFMLLNLKAALRNAGPTRPMRPLVAGMELELQPEFTRLLPWAAAVLAVMLGLAASGQWTDWLLFLNGPAFGEKDPLLGTDIGFYIFKLPLLNWLAGFGMRLVLFSALLVVLAFWLTGAVELEGERLRAEPKVLAHLSVLGAIALLIQAGNFWLDRYQLLLGQGNVVFGASYSDAQARLPALAILIGLSLVAALALLVNIRLRTLWLPAAAVGLLVVAALAGGQLYPALVQQLAVNPDEQSKERPYITRHIAATRHAYGLDRAKVRTHALGGALTRADLQQENSTLQNIRLWDYRVLARTFQRIQGLRNYYDVSQVDVDRYVLDGRLRQVMIAPRELLAGSLSDNLRWVNRRLQYTHGYGFVAAAVNEVDQSGRPFWITSDLPLRTPPELNPERPQLYYTSQYSPPVVAPSRTPELDYLAGSQAVTSSYEGEGGIPIGGALRKSMLAVATGDWNIALTDQMATGSKLLIRRDISQRAARLAPFLRYDHDPYAVVLKDRLYWIQDAYTVASTFPYSDPTDYRETPMLRAMEGSLGATRSGNFNYIRNSVKVITDAYSGRVTYYVMDDIDPVLRAYRRIFPRLFTPQEEMPANLRAHIRYPENLFMLQAGKLLRYHVEEADIFYQGSDNWQIPTERLGEGTSGGSARMEAYYVVMRMPGSDTPEFRLILPFRTRAGTTMAAWLSGGCDGDNYGALELFEFPTSNQVDAPEQVDQAISSDPDVSTQTTLLSQVGSDVLYGNLLVLPVGNSILYVKPFYVQGADTSGSGAIPLLKRVILAEKRGNDIKVVIEPTLNEALRALVGGPSSPAPADDEPAADTPADEPTPAGQDQLARRAKAAFERAERALGAGQWAEYGRSMAEVRSLIERMAAPGSTSPPAGETPPQPSP